MEEKLLREGIERAVDRLLTIDQLAEATGLPVSWWYSRTATGRVPHLKLGRYVRFKLPDVQRWLETHRRGD